jgi:hypothetical protein
MKYFEIFVIFGFFIALTGVYSLRIQRDAEENEDENDEETTTENTGEFLAYFDQA